MLTLGCIALGGSFVLLILAAPTLEEEAHNLTVWDRERQALRSRNQY